MLKKDHFSLTTLGLAIALTMGGCAAPVDEQDPANAPAEEQASQQQQQPTGEVSSAETVVDGDGVAPANGFVPFGGAGLGFGGAGLGFGAAGAGFGAAGLGFGAGFGMPFFGGFLGAPFLFGAPFIGFRGDTDAAPPPSGGADKK